MVFHLPFGNSLKCYLFLLGFLAVGNGFSAAGERVVIDDRLDPIGSHLPIVKLSPVKKTVTVLIDPGHGGKDLGAQAPGLSEKKISMEVAKMTKTRLEELAKKEGVAVSVRLTRSKDDTLSLRERVKLANEWPADLFVSVHANASTSNKPKGFEVYFLSSSATDEEATKLAAIENEVPSETGKISSGVLAMLYDAQQAQHVLQSAKFAEGIFKELSKNFLPSARGVRQGPFTVLAGTMMPAILVEIGYLTNQEDAANLRSFSYLKALSGAISTGILGYVKSTSQYKS